MSSEGRESLTPKSLKVNSVKLKFQRGRVEGVHTKAIFCGGEGIFSGTRHNNYMLLTKRAVKMAN